jgi:lipid-A-disaccharide synthase
MRLFISAGEPSGDLHGANLVRAIRRMDPRAECHGFGGDKMADAGCQLLYPLCNLAITGFFRVVTSIPLFWDIYSKADHYFRTHRPDAVVLIDYPGFHWWLADCARKRNIPVYYFVPPQIWAWACWRHRKMRRLVDHVLCALPFEERWFRKHHIPVTYVGHPYFDELRQQRLDGQFMGEQRARPGTVIGLLPGSRNKEIEFNVPSLLKAAGIIHARKPHVRFLFACFNARHQRVVRDLVRGHHVPIEVHAGRTPEIIQLAHSCLAVSGSVGLELLYRGKPSVVTYREHWFGIMGSWVFKRSPFISLVNLLAGKQLFPEYLSMNCQAEPMAEDILHWLNDREAYEEVCGELKTLRERVAHPGACDRAAEAIVDLLGERRGTRLLRAA